jgi:hypothetical protein
MVMTPPYQMAQKYNDDNQTRTTEEKGDSTVSDLRYSTKRRSLDGAPKKTVGRKLHENKNNR